MGMVCGKEYLVTAIWVNGKILKLMVMECTNGKMEIGMREVGIIV